MSGATDKVQVLRSARPDLEFESVEEQRGQFNDILIVDDRYVFRFPRTDAAREALAREIAMLNAVRDRLTLRVPEPELSAEDAGSGGPRFMGYEMIPGQALTYGDITETNREALAGQLAQFLQELHDTPLSEVPEEIDPSELPTAWASFYRNVCDHLFPQMREEARGRIARQFEAYFEDPQRYSFDTAVRHGDLGVGNILWDPAGGYITGIIDFSSCRPGDPAQDLGSLLVSFGSAFSDALYRHYPELESMYHRAVFYTGTYALQQALAALEDGDDEMFEEAFARFR